MKAKGLKHERETVIRFDEDAATASLWTASGTVCRRLLKRLGTAHLAEDGERHAIFTFPQRWLILPRSRLLKVRSPSNPINPGSLGLKRAPGAGKMTKVP